MSHLKKILPLSIIPASLYLLNHFLLKENFSPPPADANPSFKLLNCKNISYIEENGLPFPTYINHSGNPVTSLDGSWLFRVDRNNEGTKKKWYAADFQNANHRLMSVPGCFNTAESPLRDYVGSVWYQKKFALPSAMVRKGKWLRLSCGGIAFKSSVWLNGAFLGENHNGYAPFYYDISRDISLTGENTLTVMVSNDLDNDSLPPKHYDSFRMGWHQYGGIHKSVIIEAIPRSYCFKINPVTSLKAQEGKIELKALFESRANTEREEGEKAAGEPLTVKITIKDPDGKICAASSGRVDFTAGKSVAALTDTIKIKTPRSWSAENPALYSLILKTPLEEQRVNFGFRSLKTDNGKIIINGNPVILKGISRHEEDLPDGLAQKKESVCREMQLIKECGGNYARLAHYPHSPEALDFADREGLYIWTEIPLYQAGVGFFKLMLQKTKADKEKNIIKNFPGTFALMNQLCRPQLMQNSREAILKLAERHLNHPSIIFWGLGNECWTFNPAGLKALKWLKNQLLQIDRSRLVSYAALCIPVITEKFERSFEAVDVIAVNEYHGWYYGKTEQAEKFLERIHRRNPGKPVLISETGSDCVYGLHDSASPPQKGYSEEYQRHLLKTKWEALRENPWFAGWSIWVLKDFLCMEYLEDNPVPYYNLKGLIDRHNRKKLSYHLLKSLY